MTTKHAQRRMRQRGIPPLIVTWLLDFGHMRYDHHGGIVYYFDKHSRRTLERMVDSRTVARFSDFLNAYAVSSTSDEILVTVGHRYQRV